MKSSRWLILTLVLVQFVASQASLTSAGLVGLGVAGLLCLKIYYGMKLLTRMLRDDAGHNFDSAKIEPSSHGGHLMLNPNLRRLGGYGDRREDISGDENSTENDQQKSLLVVPVTGIESERSVLSTAVPQRRIRRSAAPMALKFSSDMLRWIAKIDDEKCIHRYFCYLGAKPRSFSRLGRLTNFLIMMRMFPDESWAVKMYRSGQQGTVEACPTECSDRQLMKATDYLDRHIFDLEEGPSQSSAPFMDIH